MTTNCMSTNCIHRIKGYFKALGCDVKIDLKQNSKTAELLAPPVFPKPKKRK